MEFLDARRLTGPNVVLDGPGGILDVDCTPERAVELAPVWERHVRHMLHALDWTHETEFASLPLIGGISLAFTAPIDALYAASEINEWAFAACAHELDGADEPDFEATVAALRASMAEEANPSLLRLQAEAELRGTTFLWDDDEASLGLGISSQTWPARELPDPDDLDWSQFGDVSVGLVTGTNGKTTSVRMAQHIARQTGLTVGVSSTDWIAIGDQIVDKDDWAGPGGARAVLRERQVELAILETARGGLLRRGLGVETATASLITNISEDHIGDFGSKDLHELLHIKWIIGRVVEKEGRLIVNADDALLRERAANHKGEIIWFSLDPDNETVVAHTNAGGTAFIAAGDDLIKIENGDRELLCNARDMPITMNGVARHNVANALGAAALTWCLGMSADNIRAGLVSMSADDNPGRCNVWEVEGRKVLVDFAHNHAAMQSLFTIAQALPGKRRVLCFGHAGDRPDELLREVARDAWSIGLDRVVISELAKYHRGREHGDIFKVIRDELVRIGASEDQVEHNEEEIESFRSALEWAEPGDLVIMIALASRDAVHELLEEMGATPG